MTDPTFVLVHGSGSNGRAWSNVQRELGLRGLRSVAVDLPGRGAGFTVAYHEQDLAAFAAQPSGVADVTASATVDHVVDVVRRVHRHGPVVLVGHSFGGLVVTEVGNRVPELLARMVYISAQCPVTRPAAEYPTLPSFATSLLAPAAAALMTGNPLELGCIRMNWRGADRPARDALRQAIAAESTDDEF